MKDANHPLGALEHEPSRQQRQHRRASGNRKPASALRNGSIQDDDVRPAIRADRIPSPVPVSHHSVSPSFAVVNRTGYLPAHTRVYRRRTCAPPTLIGTDLTSTEKKRVSGSEQGEKGGGGKNRMCFVRKEQGVRQ